MLLLFVLCFFFRKNNNESFTLNSGLLQFCRVLGLSVGRHRRPQKKGFRVSFLITEHVYVVLFLFPLAHRHGRFHQQVKTFELILVVADDAFNLNGGRRVLRVVIIAAAVIVVIVDVRIGHCRRRRRRRRRRCIR